MEEEEEKIIKTDVDFLVTIGYIFIIVGVIGAIGVIVSSEWERYSKIQPLVMHMK